MLFLLVLIIIGSTGWFFYKHQQAAPAQVKSSGSALKNSSTAIVVKVHANKALPNQADQFEFYTLLPAMTVNVKQSSPQSSANNMAHANYVLQVVSVQNLQAANKVQDRLAQSGFSAFVVDSKQENVMWHRVLVGPYPTLSRAQHTQEGLKKMNLESLIMLEKKGMSPHISDKSH